MIKGFVLFSILFSGASPEVGRMNTHSFFNEEACQAAAATLREKVSAAKNGFHTRVVAWCVEEG